VSIGKGLVWVCGQVTADADAWVRKDIPESACRHQPHNFFAHLFANLVGKVTDSFGIAYFKNYCR